MIKTKGSQVISEKSITFAPSNRTVKALEGKSVLEVALRYGLELNHSCGGMGSCTTCRVFIEEGLELLPERNEMELERAEERSFEENERLSCQIPALPGLKIRIP